MTSHHRPSVTITNPGGLAELLPFLLGHYPDDRMVLHCITGNSITNGFAATTPLPESPAYGEAHAKAFAHEVLAIAHDQGTAPRGVILYLCREPRPGHSPQHTAETLRPLAQWTTDACAAHGVPVLESLGITAGRWWSYNCDRPECCDGEPLPPIDAPDSTRADLIRHGLTHGPRASEITAQFTPLTTEQAPGQLTALETAHANLTVQTITTPDGHADTRRTTVALLKTALANFQDHATELDNDTTAQLILGLQDREARDQALRYGDGDTAAAAHSLWTHLARRCIPPYDHMAAPPLTLLGWTAWSRGDTVTARLAFHRALATDPDYTMAGLLHELINTDTNPEPFRTVLREAAAAEHADS